MNLVLFLLLFTRSNPSSGNDLNLNKLNGRVSSINKRSYVVVDSFGVKVKRLAGTETCEYNPKGYISKYISTESNGSIIEKLISSFDANGIKKETSYYTYGKYLNKKRTYKYTEGLVTEVKEYKEHGEPVGESTLLYEEGRLIKIYNFSSGANYPDSVMYKYDSLGRIISECKHTDCEYGKTYRYGYMVDTSIQWEGTSATQVVSALNSDGRVIESHEYQLSSDGEWSENENVSYFPIKNYKVEYTLDSEKNEIERRYYTLQFGKYELAQLDKISIKYYNK